MLGYRLLLALYGFLVAVGLVVGNNPDKVSPALAYEYAIQPPPTWLPQDPWLAIALLAPFLAAIISGYIGLFFFKRWARALSLGTTLAAFAVTPFLGPQLSSSLEVTRF